MNGKIILLAMLALVATVGLVGCSNDSGDAKPIIDKPAEPGKEPAMRKGVTPPGGAPAGAAPANKAGGGTSPSAE